MKTIVGLIVMVTIVFGAMVGCDSTSSEPGYKDVTVGPMTVSVPDDWQRPADYAELMEEFFAAFTEEESQAVELDGYGDESEDVAIVLMTMDMVEMAESAGFSWRGWDIELEESGVTTEEFAEMAQGNLMAELTELSRETHRQLTIGGHEAWESTYTAKSEGESVQVCMMIVFAPDDMGMLLLIVSQDKWSESEEVWEEIRDSVQFQN